MLRRELGNLFQRLSWSTDTLKREPIEDKVSPLRTVYQDVDISVAWDLEASAILAGATPLSGITNVCPTRSTDLLLRLLTCRSSVALEP